MHNAPAVTAIQLKICLGLLAIVLLAIALIDQPLRTAITPYGIVSFEFCAFTHSCDAALHAWGQRGREFAMLSIGVDFLFMLLYSMSIALSLWITAQRLTTKHRKTLTWLGWAALAAGIADAIETSLLAAIIIVDSGSATGAPFGMVAAIAASIKFAMLLITLPVAVVAPRFNRQPNPA